mmetsp:Transcript_32104/g.78217  ORF Transcript_32104/g.78217 Transcript_32104/m.78217 type:complete len:236 (-) Transcript_32104:452-1159(-)
MSILSAFNCSFRTPEIVHGDCSFDEDEEEDDAFVVASSVVFASVVVVLGLVSDSSSGWIGILNVLLAEAFAVVADVEDVASLLDDESFCFLRCWRRCSCFCFCCSMTWLIKQSRTHSCFFRNHLSAFVGLNFKNIISLSEIESHKCMSWLFSLADDDSEEFLLFDTKRTDFWISCATFVDERNCSMGCHCCFVVDDDFDSCLFCCCCCCCCDGDGRGGADCVARTKNNGSTRLVV